MRANSAYSEILSYFANYPRHSSMTDHSRATLFTIVRMLRPRVVGEIGTRFADATEVMARALWENAMGVVHTMDPLGAERCPAIIGGWPQEMRDKTIFRPLASTDFFLELDREQVLLDMVLINGNHASLLNLQMAARLLRPGGVMVIGETDHAAPFEAVRAFVASQHGWDELGSAIALPDPSRPLDAARTSLPGTSFVVLQQPPHVALGLGSHSWNQAPLRASSLEGFSLDLPAQVTGGTLSYQAFLRPLTNARPDLPEIKTSGRVRLDLTGPATTLTRDFEAPLQPGMQSRSGDAAFTVEIDLSWDADPGAPPLVLARAPRTLASPAARG